MECTEEVKICAWLSVDQANNKKPLSFKISSSIVCVNQLTHDVISGIIIASIIHSLHPFLSHNAWVAPKLEIA